MGELENRVRHHIKICAGLGDLYEEKNRRYGNSFHKSYEEYGLTMLAIRLEDKLLRFKQLIKNPEDCGDEPITDTLRDLANYAIMGIMELEDDACKSPVEYESIPENTGACVTMALPSEDVRTCATCRFGYLRSNQQPCCDCWHVALHGDAEDKWEPKK